MVAAHTPDRLRDVRTAYSPAQPRAAPARAGADGRAAAGRRGRPARDGGARRWRSWAAARRRPPWRPRSSLDAASTCWRRPHPGQRRAHGHRAGAARRRSRRRPAGTTSPRSTSTARSCWPARSSAITDAERVLELFGERYERAKRERSGLGLEDLELVSARPARRRRRAARTRRALHGLVDEFQDTNPLQNEVLELLARDNLFRVGDENQSIYRFRNADVGVFPQPLGRRGRGGRAEHHRQLPRPRRILDAIDLAFMRTWGLRFEPLQEADGARARVDLRRADGRRQAAQALGQARPRRRPLRLDALTTPPWRSAEARLLAKRVDELTAAGPYRFGDVVMLFRATTAMGFFERALEERLASPCTWSAGAAASPSSRCRPASLAVGPREPARRTGRVLAARVAARGPLARRGRADRPARAALAPRPVVGRERAG